MASSFGEAGAALTTRRAGVKSSVWMLMRDYGHGGRGHAPPVAAGAGRPGPVDKMASVQPVRRLFRPATWLAILAVLGLAIAPTISHALAASGPGNPWA
jgi:hypothetical protein